MDSEKKFLLIIADTLELESNEVSLSTDFRNDVEDFDSLMGFSIIVALDENYHKRMPVQEFMKCKTVGDLYNYILGE